MVKSAFSMFRRPLVGLPPSMTSSLTILLRRSIPALLGISLIACGGSGELAAGSQGALANASGSAPSPGAGTPVVLPPILTPDTALPALAVPATIANGSVVELSCGRTYRGTLDLRGKSNVTVRTAGTCGKAVISPGQPITGWSQYQGQIWSAPISFDAAQVLVDGAPAERAHWPNRPQTWAKASGSSATTLSYAMPNADLAGATLVFRPFEWAIEARRITAYANGVMSLASLNDAAFGGFAPAGQPDFYVEGKLWMLDAPGEWAIANGRLYLWTADGQSPEGRAWASPDQHGVDADNASNVILQDISIFAAANGINAAGARNLQVNGVDISNASRYGIWNSGGSALQVDGANIRNVRNDAIAVRWGGGGEVVRNSRIEAAGVVGMPTNSRAAINLTLSANSTIQNNTVINSGYIGIRFFRNSSVLSNTVDGACLVLTDCGGMYGMADDGSPLGGRIDGNTISRVGAGQRLAWGIYLDAANGMSILNNRFSGNANGINIQDSSNLTASGNSFENSQRAHVQMVETAGAPKVRGNSLRGNSFVARNGEESYRLSSDLGTESVLQFGVFDANGYLGSSPVFANFNGEALSFAQWQARTGQDGASTSGVP
ncbi:right-handed parallel beta-helix repeat-containing protein [Lacisediminimonas profundi]|uniref:right-handed parallel beta-helix repeat-containing protein n=1 Tax=Lacisediminimonas profundi TaxID=2603856 RepID=UPI00124B3613|nr:right-handed parallel beta-helix repeat-containing protein [Lacisediminimonas profundi]